MRKTKLIFIILCLLVTVAPVNVNAKESREQLLESALLNRYYPLLWQATESQFECQRIVSIKRLGEKNEFVPQFEVKAQLLTFVGAHNPPHDLVTITIEDTLYEIKIIDVVRKQNVSPEDAIKACES